MLQISDLHISHFRPNSKATLDVFENQTLPPFLPLASALIVTGDLVHAITRLRFPFKSYSKQLPEEWAFLDNFAARINGSIPWIAVHGNHDSFGGTLDPTHRSALSCPAQKLPVRRVILPGVMLLALDCTLPHPLHRPLNFFGDATLAASHLPSTLEHQQLPTLVFAHYPSAVMRNGHRLHTTEHGKSKFAAFLSGHLHTLNGLAPNGLQAVTTGGAFELELADMVKARVFRVLVFDRGYLSFKDFPLTEDRVVVITNPPRAGFCAPGAGEFAARSEHVRMVAPGDTLENAQVFVDSDFVGQVSVVEACEDDDVEKCVKVYGAAWEASRYDDGRLHELAIRFPDGQVSDKHVFSFDGLAKPGFRELWRVFVSALFSLSDFDAMAGWLCHLGFWWCFLFLTPGLMRAHASSLTLFAAAVVLKFGPAFILGFGLSDVDGGLGMVGLNFMRLSSGVYPSGVDAAFMMATAVLYSFLIPACFLDFVSTSRLICNRAGLVVAYLYAALCLFRSLMWCFEITGAHGTWAGLLSPSCVPLFITLTFSIFFSTGRIRKNTG